MSEQSPIDRLAAALDASRAGAQSSSASDDRALTALLRIAEDLHDLPHPTFRSRLRADLLRRASMSLTSATPIRTSVQTLTVYLAVRAANELVDFVKRAFGAEELLRTTGSAGGLHAEVMIGDTKLMIGGGDAWGGTPTPTSLHLYVTDADSTYRRAIEAGAISRRAPVDQPYGDREAAIVDLAGNHWYIATHQGATHVPAGLGSVTPYLHPRGSDRLIEFLRQAFDAQEMEVEREPDRTVKHAKIRIGRSVLEMGEAHGEWSPMPTMLYMHVDDVDAAYRRALAAGGTSQEAPALQPYGERRAAVLDACDNQWYLASPST
jgi:PhnB protein